MNDPLHFPQPQKFDPDRFVNPETGKFIPHPRVVPFGLGKRRCLGKRGKYFICWVNPRVLRIFYICFRRNISSDVPVQILHWFGSAL
jgi:hypothetical protein